MAHTPRMADVKLAQLRRLLSWAYDRGRIDVNHALKIEPLVPAGHSRKDCIWTTEDQHRFLAVVPEAMRRLFLIALYTCQRKSDLCRLSWSNLDDDGWLAIKQGKTGAKVELPVFALRPLNDIIATLPHDQAVMLTTAQGRPWKADNVRTRFTEYRHAVGIEDLTFHDLRGTGLQMLAEAGCTEKQIAAVTGHQTLAMVQHYTKGADQKWLAKQAVDMWDKNGSGKH